MPSQSIGLPDDPDWSAFIACHACDCLHHRTAVGPSRELARCQRCGTCLYTHKTNSIDRTFAWALAALFVFVPANFSPIMTLSVLGEIKTNTVASGVMEMLHFNLPIVAMLCLLTGIVIPIIKILSLLYVLGTVKWGGNARRAAKVFRHYLIMRQWGMLEVYLLGIFISLIKLRDLASIDFGLGFYAFIVLLVCIFGSAITLEPAAVWASLKERK